MFGTTVVPQVPGTSSSKVAAHSIILYVTLSWCTVLWWIMKRLLLCYHPCSVFFLDDSVCSLFWLCLMMGLQCAVRVSGCVTTDCNGWTLQGGKTTAACIYVYLFMFQKLERKHIIRNILTNKMSSNGVLNKLLLSLWVRVPGHCSSFLFRQH